MSTQASWQEPAVEPWRVIAERKIKDWLDAGGADRLPRVKPIDLSENPFLKPEYRLAFKVLRNAGIAPDWIMLGNDVEAGLTRLREKRRRYHHPRRADLTRLRQAGAESAIAIVARMGRHRDEFIADYREDLHELNRLIDRFNVAVPIMNLGRVRLNVEAELREALREDVCA